jgi:hypothetical protein
MIKWNKTAFMALEAPAAYPTCTREAADNVSHYLYAADEAKKAKAAKKAAALRAKARVGVKVFSWEMGA